MSCVSYPSLCAIPINSSTSIWSSDSDWGQAEADMMTLVSRATTPVVPEMISPDPGVPQELSSGSGNNGASLYMCQSVLPKNEYLAYRHYFTVPISGTYTIALINDNQGGPFIVDSNGKTVYSNPSFSPDRQGDHLGQANITLPAGTYTLVITSQDYGTAQGIAWAMVHTGCGSVIDASFNDGTWCVLQITADEMSSPESAALSAPCEGIH